MVLKMPCLLLRSLSVLSNLILRVLHFVMYFDDEVDYIFCHNTCMLNIRKQGAFCACYLNLLHADSTLTDSLINI